MKKTILGIILIGTLLAYQVQGSMGLWKYTGDLSPVVNTWDVSLGGDLEMKDDKILYFDTAKTQYLGYDTNYTTVKFDDGTAYGYFASPRGLNFVGNAGAAGAGTWEPAIQILEIGSVYITNTTQGSAGDKYLLVDMTDGIRLDTGGTRAIIKADNIATADKTFQFPNASGTFIIGEGVGAGQTLIGGTTTTSDLTLQTTSGVGTTGADMHFKVGNNGATEAMTILNNGKVGIGKNAPVADFHVKSISAAGNIFTIENSAGATAFTMNNANLAARFRAPGTASIPTISWITDTNTGFWHPADDTMAISTGGSEKMRITSTGNVGIGTTDPDTNLHINDASATTDFYIESGGAGLGGRIILEDTDGAGCTALTTLNGVLTAAIIACP